MIDYNIVNLSIENGLKNYEIASNKNYIHLLEVPPLANVRVKLNNNMGDDIPLKENYAIKSGLIEKIYISADSVPGGTIKIGQSNSADGFEIITAPTINSIDSLGSIAILNDMHDNLISKLDKIINPYILQNETILNQHTTSTLTVFDKVLSCDRIDINLSLHISSNNNVWGRIFFYIDEVLVQQFDKYASTTIGFLDYNNKEFYLETIKNKRFRIDVVGSNTTTNFIIKEKILKA